MFCGMNYIYYLCKQENNATMLPKEKEAYKRLEDSGLRPSVQRLIIMDYLLLHHTHPTVDEVHKDLGRKFPTLSKTTVYNTLRLFSECKAAQMITIDEHRVCYDGVTVPHAHFYCRRCGRIIDMDGICMPQLPIGESVGGNTVDEVQLYYKGICAKCSATKE